MSKDVHLVLKKGVTLESLLSFVHDRFDHDVKNVPIEEFETESPKTAGYMTWAFIQGFVEFEWEGSFVSLHYSILDDTLLKDNYPEADNNLEIGGDHLVVLADAEKVHHDIIRAICRDLGASMEINECSFLQFQIGG